MKATTTSGTAVPATPYASFAPQWWSRPGQASSGRVKDRTPPARYPDRGALRNRHRGSRVAVWLLGGRLGPVGARRPEIVGAELTSAPPRHGSPLMAHGDQVSDQVSPRGQDRLAANRTDVEVLEEAERPVRLSSAARLSPQQQPDQETVDLLRNEKPPQIPVSGDVVPRSPRVPAQAGNWWRQRPLARPAPQTLQAPRLAQLADELDDAEALARFVQVFLTLLPGRVHAVTESLRQPVANSTIETSRNLIATCRMIGAEALVDQLQRIAEASAAEEVSSEERRALVTESFDRAWHLRAELLRQLGQVQAHQSAHDSIHQATAR